MSEPPHQQRAQSHPGSIESGRPCRLALVNPQEQVRLGGTPVQVTRLGLGAAPLGGLYQELTDEAAAEVVQASWDSGIRLFDTAPLYGYGVSERRLGSNLRDKPRGEFALATKVGRLLRPGVAPDPSQFHNGEPFFKGAPPVSPVFDFGYDGVMRSVEESLDRLGLDRIDILHIHDPDDHYEAALAGAYRALDRLRSEGSIGAVGAGMNQAAMLARFARAGRFDCVLLAGRYTLLDQSGLEELLPLCQTEGISVIAGGAFNSGVLAGPGPGARYNYVPAPPEILERACRIASVCEHHGVPLKAAAVQFPLGHPAVASVLVGCRSPLEVKENVEMFRHPIPSDLWRELKHEGLLSEEVPVP